MVYANGQAVPQDFARAASLFQKACDGGAAIGCKNLGVCFHEGKGVTQDLSRAAVFLEKACDGGLVEGCGILSDLYADGRGVPKDLARANAILERAAKQLQSECNDGLAASCTELATMRLHAKELNSRKGL